MLGSAAAWGIGRPGAIGRATPGHDVAVLRPDGARCEPGEPGGIAVRRPDPTLFLGYWGRPEATAAKFTGEWMTTGDQATADEDGFVTFLGRDDDIITSSGFRIGPVEIEDCLIRHPAVAAAAVVGVPDPLRTEIVKAWIVPRDGVAPSDALAAEIGAFVRSRLSAHEYPRAVAFAPALPMTATGKVMRGSCSAHGGDDRHAGDRIDAARSLRIASGMGTVTVSLRPRASVSTRPSVASGGKASAGASVTS